MQLGLETMHHEILSSKTDILLSYFSTCLTPYTFIENLNAENTWKPQIL